MKLTDSFLYFNNLVTIARYNDLFPGTLEGMTNSVKLQTGQAEELPEEVTAEKATENMTVFDQMRVSKMEVKIAEPDANCHFQRKGN